MKFKLPEVIGPLNFFAAYQAGTAALIIPINAVVLPISMLHDINKNGLEPGELSSFIKDLMGKQ